MISKGPFQPKAFYDSVIILRAVFNHKIFTSVVNSWEEQKGGKSSLICNPSFLSLSY